jgi:hypothetical protein
MNSLPVAQGNDVYVTQEGRISNGSTPSAFQFEQLIEKYKDDYKNQPSMDAQQLLGRTVLDEFNNLDPPGRIWLESPEKPGVFLEVTNECQAAHICRIFLILAWHPLDYSENCFPYGEDDDENRDRAYEVGVAVRSVSAAEESDVVVEHERRNRRERGGLHPVIGSITVDFFATFSRIYDRVSRGESSQQGESSTNSRANKDRT